MNSEGPALFYLEEPLYGCSQPVRKGDLLIVNNESLPFSGKPFVVMSVIDKQSHGGFWSGIFVNGLCNGKIFELHESELKLVRS